MVRKLKRWLSAMLVGSLVMALMPAAVYATGRETEKKSYFQGHTYQVFDESLTWQEAKSKCETLGGHLATITSEGEQSFITQIISTGSKEFYWLGGSDEVSEGQWDWVTGEPWSYEHWASGNPDNYNSENYLGILRVDRKWANNSGKSCDWNDFSNKDARLMGFVCEWDSESPDPDLAAAGDGSRSFQGHTYQVFDGVCDSWQGAKEYCESRGGHLATITSFAENDFLYSYITSQGYECAYFGLSNESRDNRSWAWVTGEPFAFINWADGEPNASYEPYGMFYFKFTDGKWNDGDFGGQTERGGTAFVCEWDNQGSEPIIADTISDEAVLRAKLLTVDHSFKFYRNWDSPVQVMAEQLDPAPALTWYTVENLIEMYYEAAKSGDVSSANVGEVSSVEFYEYLLFKLLDSEELDYLSVTEPFGLIGDLTAEAVDTDLLEKLASEGFKSGTKIASDNKSKIKKVCQSVCGTDSITDIGWMDTILVAGKTIDDFASEFVKLYALTTVSDARAEAIRAIGEHAKVPALQTAAENVYASIHQAKRDGIEYCVSGGIEESVDGLAVWLLDKMVDAMCDIHPASKLWKATADGTTFVMDTVFLTDDISTDAIYILGMANVEHALLDAIDQAETTFLKDDSVANAQKLIALADTFKRALLEGCDLVIAQVDHCERGDLNWHGILDLLNMAKEKKFDFGATMKWIFGDENSSYAKLRESVTNIKQNIEETNFYVGSLSVLELLREVRSTTPSAWASNEINKAINYGILPDWMRNNYQNNITRIEFCALLEYMIERKTGKTASEWADELAQQQGGYIKAPFDDALYMEVNDIARLGIINGVGNNQFNPLGEITRQEAAAMLYRTADALGYNTTSQPYDHSGVAKWAVDGVDFVTTAGIMNGTGNGFDPMGKYTKEQAVLTMVRFFENVH